MNATDWLPHLSSGSLSLPDSQLTANVATTINVQNFHSRRLSLHATKHAGA